MKCSFCGEEVGDVSVCPVCGSSVVPKRAPVSAGQESGGRDDGVSVFDNNVNAVLEIECATGLGSGYLISSDGYGITNSHVVCLKDGKSCGKCKVKIAGEAVPAVVVAMGTENNEEHASPHDLALIKLSYVPPTAKAVHIGDSDSVRTGERIFVIGNSMGGGTCITGGIVSDNDRDGLFMYDCPTNPGNSGGPVFNAEGSVIGTHVAGFTHNGVKAQGMNYAIPEKYVKAFVKSLGVEIKP